MIKPFRLYSIHSLSSLLFSILFFLFVYFHIEYKEIIEFDTDEGINMMKALLVKLDYQFLDQIWSDQPPLLTYLFKFAFEIFGWHTAIARTLILFFSSIIVFVVYDSIQREFGHLAALTAVILLIFSTMFAQLSVSAMIGLPAIALAVLSFWCLSRWHDDKNKLWILAISGCLYACSIAAKLFTLFLLPLACFLILNSAYRHKPSKDLCTKLKPLLFWIAGFISCALLVFWPVISSENVLALFLTHDKSRQLSEGWIHYRRGSFVVPYFVKQDIWIYILAIPGMIMALTRKSFTLTWASLWLIIAAIALYTHKPVWPHHCILLSVPASILAGTGIYSVTKLFNKLNLSKPLANIITIFISALLLLVFFSSNPERLKTALQPTASSNQIADLNIIQIMRLFDEQTKMIISSRQIYPFILNKPVPPKLAVTSYKNFQTKEITITDILEAADFYHPEQIILTNRWDLNIRNQIRKHIKDDYTKIYIDPQNYEAEVFIKNSVLRTIPELSSDYN